jgi:hypothetical protein
LILSRKGDPVRKSNFFFLYLTFNIILLSLMFIHASAGKKAGMKFIQEKVEMVRKFELTDLCLFTEARYTRHISQADLHAPFQDSPTSLEHFPSGSLAMPPPSMRRRNGELD